MRLKMAGAAFAALALVGTTLVAATPAEARWWGHRHGWWGPGAGFAAGALIGGALAARPYYDGPGYYYGPGPYAYEAAPQGDDDATAYCLQRFKSYDVRSGTYLGYDGERHPCP